MIRLAFSRLAEQPAYCGRPDIIVSPGHSTLVLKDSILGELGLFVSPPPHPALLPLCTACATNADVLDASMIRKRGGE